jgi:excisionase family DNA binding protein
MQMNSVIESPLFTTAEAAAYLRMSRTSLLRLRTAGHLQSISLGTITPYFRRVDLDAYITRCAERS